MASVGAPLVDHKMMNTQLLELASDSPTVALAQISKSLNNCNSYFPTTQNLLLTERDGDLDLDCDLQKFQITDFSIHNVALTPCSKSLDASSTSELPYLKRRKKPRSLAKTQQRKASDTIFTTVVYTKRETSPSRSLKQWQSTQKKFMLP